MAVVYKDNNNIFTWMGLDTCYGTPKEASNPSQNVFLGYCESFIKKYLHFSGSEKNAKYA